NGGDEEVAAGRDRIEGLVDVAGHVAAHVDHCVPGPGDAGVVARRAVAVDPGDLGEQLRVRDPPAEQRRVVPAVEEVVHDRAADEGGATEHEDVHGANV